MGYRKWLRLRFPGLHLPGWRQLFGLCDTGGKGLEQQLHTPHAIDQGVVNFHVDCDAPVLQPLDQMHAPQGILPVEMAVMQPGYHCQKFPDAPRIRKRGVGKVMVQIEFFVLTPVMHTPALHQAPIEWRDGSGGLPQPGSQFLSKVLAGPCRGLQKHQNTDMQRLPPAFQTQEGVIQ